MAVLKVSRIGNSLGLILPRELLSELNLEQGDQVQLTCSEGGFTVTVYDPTVAKQVDTLRAVMKKRRSALRELAR